MEWNMRDWVQKQLESPVKKGLPIISYPAIQMMGITVKELIQSADLQAEGMKLVAERTNAAAAVSLMDLSVEAEAFGSEIRVTEQEVPNVVGSIIESEEDAKNLTVPKIGTGRTSIYIAAIKKAAELIQDRPVLAGVIGPFSLAGRLMDVTEVMYLCFDEPDMVHMVLEKVTEFLIAYIKEYKAAGANGVVIAEPLAGLLGPDLADEFSVEYMKRIVDAVQEKDFAVVTHNCGNTALKTAEGIFSNGSMAYHFGNCINMKEMLKIAPSDRLIMGNVDPAGEFLNGSKESIYAKTKALLEECGMYQNFVISSGCDVPPLSSWDNIESFFQAVSDYYQGK
ncbi:MAG: uroporphyrinogen decarboxylase family protein [Clostridium sp.]|nr:uroporphyrinogen decarboxylase family protein [Clostridium sp.]